MENLLLTAERTTSVISAALDRPAPDLGAAWDSMLFNTFHDILPGTSIESAYEDQHAWLGVAYHDLSGTGSVSFTAVGTAYTFGGLQGVGTLTATGKTIALNSTGSSAVTISGASAFQSSAAITVTSSGLTLGGTLTVNFSSTLTPGNSYSFNLFDGQTAGTFGSVSIAGSYVATLNSGNSYAFTDVAGNNYSFNNGTGDLAISVAAIPEPSTCAMIAGALTLGLAASRRRRTVAA